MNQSERFGFRTEIDFTLPKGFVDASGTLHRKGLMRLATAADEILPLRDPRVQQNEAYLTVIVLARVVIKLGTLADIDTAVIEGLFASDLAYLQRQYEALNAAEEVDPAQAPFTNGAMKPNLSGMTTLGEA